MDGTQFTLHLNPYFLRLNFPHPVVEDDASSASYDPSSGYFTASVSKETRGQDFQDLDLLAKLLAPPPLSSDLVSPVEVLSSTDTLGHNIFDKSDEDSLVSEIKYLDLNQEHQEILHGKLITPTRNEISKDKIRQPLQTIGTSHKNQLRHQLNSRSRSIMVSWAYALVTFGMCTIPLTRSMNLGRTQKPVPFRSVERGV